MQFYLVTELFLAFVGHSLPVKLLTRCDPLSLHEQDIDQAREIDEKDTDSFAGKCPCRNTDEFYQYMVKYAENI